MKCHICGEPSVGQCQSCWKFYCAEHGDVFCQECADVQAAAQEPSLTGNTDEPDNQESDEGPVRLEVIPGVQIGDEEELRRVIPVVQSQTRRGSRVTVVSIEVYDIGFAVIHEWRRVKGSLKPHESDHWMSLPVVSWSATDDKGREYRMGSSRSSGDAHFLRQRNDFGPSLPPDAKLLMLSVEEMFWSARRPSQRPRVERGPWRFEVPLT